MEIPLTLAQYNAINGPRGVELAIVINALQSAVQAAQEAGLTVEEIAEHVEGALDFDGIPRSIVVK